MEAANQLSVVHSSASAKSRSCDDLAFASELLGASMVVPASDLPPEARERIVAPLREGILAQFDETSQEWPDTPDLQLIRGQFRAHLEQTINSDRFIVRLSEA